MWRKYINLGGKLTTIEHAEGGIHIHQAPPPPSPTRSDEEQKLLRAVSGEVGSRLDQSLHQAVLLNLTKESQPQQVYRLWQQELKIGVKPAKLLSPDQTIAQVFSSDEINGKLLILGKPGSGKTTTLLDLAKALVERARGDVSQLIPVILNLSSWKDEKQSIREWVIRELKSKYGVSNKLSLLWLSQRRLLPLLDGLDEVAPERQQACVSRINEFLSEENSPFEVVVCSRIEEYNNLQTQLQLNGAVCLKELTDAQIETYLTSLDRTQLWQTIVANEKLLALVRSPLLLSITVLTYPQGSNSQLEQLQSVSDPLQFLLDGYVERMLHRQLDCKFESRSYGKRKPPSARETRRWLAWLAQQMEWESQTEFLIEEMQPFMLPDHQIWQYRLIFGLIFGLVVGLVAAMVGGLVKGLMGGLSFGPAGWQIGDRNIQPVETLKWSWQRGIRNMLAWGLFAGLFVGILFGLFAGLFGSNVLFGLALGLALGLIVGVALGVFEGLTVEAIDTKISPNQGIKKSAKFSLIGGAVAGLIVGLSVGLVEGLAGGLSLGLSFGSFAGLAGGLSFGLMLGGNACLKHFMLRLLLYHNKSIPWNYARFLNYCTERLFLQRVGGRYRFIHKYLQDHFATVPFEEPIN